MNTAILNGSLFAEMVKNGAANLNRNRTIVNELNVFPVPDGDTGDNMFMTIESGVQAAGEDNDCLSEVANQIAKGMLLGARGNSGVILSRIFSGIAKNLGEVKEADVRWLSEAFLNSITEAYSAVAKPVEGTILSVYRDAVQFANENLNENSDIEGFFDDLVKELHASLDRTPELLNVLKEAGVVDSGGAGFVYIAEGMKKALEGEKIDGGATTVQKEECLNYDAFTEDTELTYGYCTEFLLRLQNKKCDIEHFDLDGLTEYLNSVGDSVVSFREGSIVKVHVHTMDPGEVLTYCRQYGEFLKLKIENMNLQYNEADEESPAGKDVQIQVKKHKKYGIVTVANGEGLVNLFKELGADAVVAGGQCMNPSAIDFVNAFKSLNCDNIIVFPNNSNIIMTAEQAAGLYEKCPVYVVKTKTIGEGYAAISMMDTTLPTVEDVLEEAKLSLDGVVTGMVSKANRDTTMNGVEVRSGDYIGFSGNEVFTDDGDVEAATIGLAEGLSAGDYDIMLLIRGKDVSRPAADELAKQLQAKHKRTEIILVDGLQPIYDYILVLE